MPIEIFHTVVKCCYIFKGSWPNYLSFEKVYFIFLYVILPLLLLLERPQDRGNPQYIEVRYIQVVLGVGALI